jgi:hypothetical protein
VMSTVSVTSVHATRPRRRPSAVPVSSPYT